MPVWCLTREVKWETTGFAESWRGRAIQFFLVAVSSGVCVPNFKSSTNRPSNSAFQMFKDSHYNRRFPSVLLSAKARRGLIRHWLGVGDAKFAPNNSKSGLEALQPLHTFPDIDMTPSVKVEGNRSEIVELNRFLLGHWCRFRLKGAQCFKVC